MFTKVYFVLSPFGGYTDSFTWLSPDELKYTSIWLLCRNYRLSDPMPGLSSALFVANDIGFARVIYYDLEKLMWFYYEQNSETMEK